MPEISVIMGVYNSRRDMLFKAVTSVLNQDFSDFELIICDDGSNEETKKLLGELPVDSRIRIITKEKNEGLANALNSCIDIAQGEYIARQDDDDYSSHERFTKQLAFLRAHPDIDFIGSDCYLFADNGEVYSERIMPKEITADSFLFNSPFIHGSMMFRRKVFDRHRYKTLGKMKKYEDYELFMALTADGFKSANMAEKLYYFYFEPSKRKISFAMRKDEYNVRKNGFKILKLMPKGYFYALKPIALGLIPSGIFMKIKKKSGKL